MKNIIFLGGVHGAGKGTISQLLCKSLQLQYLSASKLIKWDEISLSSTDKLVNNISQTQFKLIHALNEVYNPNYNYLLDGHFCLLNRDGKATRIDYEVFKNINPKVILLKVSEPKVIKNRLLVRDSKDYSLDFISELLSEEHEYATEIASALSIPFFKITDINLWEILNNLNKL